MNDLVTFLTARLNEDEAAARAVDTSPDTRGMYQRDGADGRLELYTPDRAAFYVSRFTTSPEDGYPRSAKDVPATALFDRMRPERVLREVEAKRRIVGAYEYAVKRGFPEVDTLAMAVRSVAHVYSDHPDCDPDWKL